MVTLLGVLALAIAGALWMGSAGVGIEPQVLLPIVAIVIGTIFFWSQLDDADPIGARRPVRWIWLVVGLTLTTLGLVGLLIGQTDVGQILAGGRRGPRRPRRRCRPRRTVDPPPLEQSPRRAGGPHPRH